VTSAVEEPQPGRILPGSFAPLGYRDYVLYWIGLISTRAGRAIEELGVVWLMYDLTSSPFLLGLLGLARALPAIALGPVAGVVSDRLNQRRMLFATQALGAIASLTVGILVATGRLEFWFLYIQVAVQASIEAFDGSARQALFPRLIARRHLPEAVTMTSAAARIASLVGPVLGGLAIATLGVAAPFFLNAASFLGLMFAVAAMQSRTAPIGHAVREPFRRELLAGFHHIRTHAVLSGLLKLEFVFGVIQINAVIITIVGREILGVGPEGLGGLLSAVALGALIGTAYLVVFGQPHRQGRFVIACMLSYVVALLGLAFSTVYPLSFLAIAAMGLLDSLSTVTRHSVMQLASPAEMRGRVMANMGTVTRATTPTSELLSGALSGLFGARIALLIGAGTLVTAASLTARTNPELMRFSRDDLLIGREADAAETADRAPASGGP
jgi:MFS family permease